MTISEFNKSYPRMPKCDRTDNNKYLVLDESKQIVLIYNTEKEAISANRLDKVDRKIIHIQGE